MDTDNLVALGFPVWVDIREGGKPGEKRSKHWRDELREILPTWKITHQTWFSNNVL